MCIFISIFFSLNAAVASPSFMKLPEDSVKRETWSKDSSI